MKNNTEIKENPEIKDKSSSFFVDKLAHWKNEKPGETYLTQPHEKHIIEYSWLDVFNNCNSISNHLCSFPRGSKVAIYSENCAHWIMADLAIQKAGLVSVPIYTSYTLDTIKNILIHSEVVAIFVGKLNTKLPPNVIPKNIIQYAMHQQHDNMISWESLIALNNQPQNDDRAIQEKEVATIIYTSGTTSKPKGVCLTLGALKSSNQLIKSVISTTEKDRFFSYLPLPHISERTVTDLNSVVHGSPVYFLSHTNKFKTEINIVKPTIFYSAPQFWIKLKLMAEESLGGEANMRRLLSLPFFGKKIAKRILKKMGLDQVRFAMCASAPISPTILEWFNSIGLKINQAYGLTETCGLSHIMRKEDPISDSVGRLVNGCEMKLSESNEIILRNPALLTCYNNDDALTQKHIDSEGWFKTGDIGSVDKNGFLYFQGRKCDSFKSSCGKYIMPTPIEKSLQKIIDIDYIIVLDIGLSQPVAVLSVFELYEVINEVQMMLDCLNAFDTVNGQLDDHEKISHIFISDEPWTTENGYLSSTRKMMRTKLHDHYYPLIKDKLIENQNNRGTVLWFDK